MYPRLEYAITTYLMFDNYIVEYTQNTDHNRVDHQHDQVLPNECRYQVLLCIDSLTENRIMTVNNPNRILTRVNRNIYK
jgi:hypothetical protein